MTAAAAADAVVPTFAFVDLDGSLFDSARKCPPGVALEAAALLSNGDVISYTTPRQRALIDWLRRGATLIPVTARSIDGFARVKVQFSGPAIVSFGGVILDAQRRPDVAWAARLHAELAGTEALLADAHALLAAAIAARGLDAWARLVVELGQTQYLLLKHRAADAAVLAGLRTELLEPWAQAHTGFRVFQNDNNLVLLPPGLDKSHAVAHLIAELRAAHGEILTLGIGDSVSDADFLRLCDFATTPAGSQLAQRLLPA